MEQKLVRLNPKKAAELLATVKSNRAIADLHVEFLAEQMRSGKWIEGFTPLVISSEGELIDGQHRCQAVIRSGKEIRVRIESGVDPLLKYVIDTGRRRTFGDVLHMRGEKNYACLAATVRRLAIYAIDPEFKAGRAVARFNNLYLLDFYERNPWIDASVDWAQSKMQEYLTHFYPHSLFAAFHYLFSLAQDEESATAFMQSLATGANLMESDSVYKLREKLLRQSRRPEAPRIPNRALCALTIKAWNNTISGSHPEQLTWHPGPPRNDAFPRIFGEEEIKLR